MRDTKPSETLSDDELRDFDAATMLALRDIIQYPPSERGKRIASWGDLFVAFIESNIDDYPHDPYRDDEDE